MIRPVHIHFHRSNRIRAEKESKIEIFRTATISGEFIVNVRVAKKNKQKEKKQNKESTEVFVNDDIMP